MHITGYRVWICQLATSTVRYFPIILTSVEVPRAAIAYVVLEKYICLRKDFTVVEPECSTVQHQERLIVYENNAVQKERTNMWSTVHRRHSLRYKKMGTDGWITYSVNNLTLKLSIQPLPFSARIMFLSFTSHLQQHVSPRSLNLLLQLWHANQCKYTNQSDWSKSPPKIVAMENIPGVYIQYICSILKSIVFRLWGKCLV